MTNSGKAGVDLLAAVLGALPAGLDLCVVRRGREWIVGVGPEEVVTASGAEAMAMLDGLSTGWWAGFLAYDLGRSIERVTSRLLPGELPDVLLARFDARLVIEGNGWMVEGFGDRRGFLEMVARGAYETPELTPARPVSLGPWRSDVSAAGYEERVRSIIDLIEAGDCYQVNLARRLTCERSARSVPLFLALARQNPAPHAALVKVGGTAVVSASPERFLRRSGDFVETRPIKGTAQDEAVLARSLKDRAENVMITDLARNDLGRVCRYGSITVPALCRLEPHPGLWHLVSTVTGRLWENVSFGALVRATFPPASVTGAPKPRVLQVIEDLEIVRRGVYCGAVGWVDADNAEVDLNVAIRTFTITDGVTHLGVGAGITAGSNPAAEWRETELKASRLLAAVGSTERAGTPGVPLAT